MTYDAGNNVQANRKNPFARPADMDPAEHSQQCSDYLDYLSACCRKSQLYNQPSTEVQGEDCGLKSWGKMIDLPKLKYSSPTEARNRSDFKCSSNISDPPATEVTDRVDVSKPESQYFPGLKSSNDLTDYNHNVTSVSKHLLLPVSSEESTKPKPKGVISTKSAADDGDSDFEPGVSTGRRQPTTKKQAPRGRAKNLSGGTKSQSGTSSQSGRGRAAVQRKKEQTGNESRRSVKPRKAKSSANSQMKLTFFSEPTTEQSDYDDALAGDVYEYGSSSSPEKKVTTTHVYSRRKEKKASADIESILPLAERMGLHMQRGQSQVTQPDLGVKRMSAGVDLPFESSSQRSSWLFDNMLEQQAQAIPREHRSSSRSVGNTEIGQRYSHLAEETADKDIESIPRYFALLFCYPVILRGLVV